MYICSYQARTRAKTKAEWFIAITKLYRRKHIRLEKFPNSDSANFILKTYHSIIVLACGDTDSHLHHDEIGNKFPYYFIRDNAFPIRRNIMRPYPEKNISNTKRIYNYRLSLGRKTIECILGMMTPKFKVLLTPIRWRKMKYAINYNIFFIFTYQTSSFSWQFSSLLFLFYL